MKAKLENERGQLLAYWRKRLQKNPDWISNELPQVRLIFSASNGEVSAQKSLGSYLRQLHDKLGYKAKGALSDGGLCAGAIFRTQRFIQTDNRNGSKAGQSVHIEHTFPIMQLRLEIAKRRFRDYVETLAWLLEHSVTTAFHNSEKEHLIGRSSTSDAVDPVSPEYLKPFARYQKLHSSAGIVWNVFDAEKVDPETFTFQRHLELVLRLLHEAGASKSMVSTISGAA